MVSRIRVPWLALTVWLLMLFLFAPLIVAALYAFSTKPILSWPFEGWSLQWFEKLFGDKLFRQALVTSTQVAVTSAIIATAIGTAAALVFTRVNSRLSGSTEALSRLPVMLPGLFIGIGFVALMILARFSPGWPVIVAGHVVVAIPWVIIVVGARLRTYDVELEAAARDLGAGPIQVVRRVMLPILAPAIVGASLLAFAWSFDETLITNFTAGQDITIPLYILARLRRTVDPTGNAVGVFLLLIPWLSFALAAIVLRRSGGMSAVMGQR